MATELTLYGRDSTAVFDLLGRGETDLTAALAWTLTRSPTLLTALWERLQMPGATKEVEVALEVADSEGRTDLELRGPCGDVIIEAKKGWLLPGVVQLSKYTGRFNGSRKPLLVTLSDSSVEYAALHLPHVVDGIPVVHLPWDAIRADLRQSLKSARGSERLWLNEMNIYLAGATAVRDPAEQWVYVVSVSKNKPADGGSRTFRDFVEKEDRYFHLFGNNWPRRPPVLMGFRWNGQLQRISRVVDSKVVGSLQEEWPDIPVTERSSQPHAVYVLGEPIPIPEIRTTGVVMARRLWVLLDQALTHSQLIDAERASKAITSQGRAD